MSQARVLFAAGFAALFVCSGPAQAQVVKQLTHVASASFRVPVLDDAGNHVYVASSTNQLGGDPSNAFQIYRFVPGTGAGTQLTTLDLGVSDSPFGLSVSDDDQWLAFASRSDPLGQNHDRSDELFVVATDGTGIVQLTNSSAPAAGSIQLVALAGSGNRIAFVSDADLTGGNAAHREQLFVIDRDGTHLAQLTASAGDEFLFLSISDDGTRIAFSHDGPLVTPNADDNYELYAIHADGTGLTRLTNFPSGDVDNVGLSGNGAKIVFHSTADPLGTNADGMNEIFVIGYDGTGLKQLTNSTNRFGIPVDSLYPAITDDALTVYFTSSQATATVNPDGSYEIWKINSDGTGKALVTSASVFGANLVVSGSGNRLAYANVPGGSPADEVHVLDTTGANLVQLTTTQRAESLVPQATPTGSRMVFASNANLTGANADHSIELYKMEWDGSGIVQLTNNYYVAQPSISPDGQTIYFSSTNNLLGTNPEGIEEIFRVSADGTGLAQMTNASGSSSSIISRGPVVSANGAVLLFFSSANFTGGNADLSGEIYKMNPAGGGIVQLTHGSDAGLAFYSYYPRVDDAGVWVVFSGNENLAGGNPDHTFEVWRIKSDGTGLQQITSSPTASSFYPDISGDGSRIVFTSNGDLTGSNPDGSFELFLYDTATAAITQITSASDGDSSYARISRDGHWAYFLSDASLLGPGARPGYELYRANLDTRVVERADGLGFSSLLYGETINELQPFPSVNTDGSRVLWAVAGDRTTGNPDLDSEIHVVDRGTAPTIQISPGSAPTVVSWDVESGPVHYDVIRGDIASLHAGLGGTVGLGPVTCVENDSGDASTRGSEDAVPAPGQVFFYLYRGSQGPATGPGSYGRGSGGGERTPDSGDCAN